MDGSVTLPDAGGAGSMSCVWYGAIAMWVRAGLLGRCAGTPGLRRCATGGGGVGDRYSSLGRRASAVVDGGGAGRSTVTPSNVNVPISPMRGKFPVPSMCRNRRARRLGRSSLG